MHTTICIYIICARIGSPPIFSTGRHGDLSIANLSQGRSGQLLSRQSYGLWNDRPWWQKLERAFSLLKNQTLCLDVSWCPQISKGFVPWLDGFWHFNKVSILFYSILWFSTSTAKDQCTIPCSYLYFILFINTYMYSPTEDFGVNSFSGSYQ